MRPFLSRAISSRASLFILALVTCSIFAACEDEIITVTPDSSTQVGAVLGYVRDELDRLPIADATIKTDPPTSTVHSDENGLFRINNAPVAAYLVTVTAPGFKGRTIPMGVEAGRVINTTVLLSSSSPDTLTLLAKVSTGGGTVGVAARGFMVFASGTAGLQVFDLTTPTNSILLGAAPMYSSYVGDVEVHGDAAYVCNRTSSLQVVDISDPGHPQATPFALGGEGHDAELDGNLLIVAADDSLIVLDASQPLALTRLGGVVTAQDGLGQGNYGVALDPTSKIAILCSFNNGVEIVDYSDPGAPKKIGSLGSSLGPWDCVLDPASARATVAGDDGLEFINYAQASNPQRISQWIPGGNGGRDVAVVGSMAIFATTFNGLRVFDISNPAQIRSRQRFHGDIGSPGNIAIEGSRVYVASDNKLLVLELPPSLIP